MTQDKNQDETLAELTLSATRFGAETTQERQLSNTVELTARLNGWTLRTWVFDRGQRGTRQVIVDAPEGFVFTEAGRAALSTKKSSNMAKAVSLAGTDNKRWSQWDGALAYIDGAGRPKGEDSYEWFEVAPVKGESAFKPGPTRAAACALISRMVAAVALDCLTDDLVAEAQAFVDACEPPAAKAPAAKVIAAPATKAPTPAAPVEKGPPDWAIFSAGLGVLKYGAEKLANFRAAFIHEGGDPDAFKQCLEHSVSTGLVEIALRDGRELITSRTA